MGSRHEVLPQVTDKLIHTPDCSRSIVGYHTQLQLVAYQSISTLDWRISSGLSHRGHCIRSVCMTMVSKAIKLIFLADDLTVSAMKKVVLLAYDSTIPRDVPE